MSDTTASEIIAPAPATASEPLPAPDPASPNKIDYWPAAWSWWHWLFCGWLAGVVAMVGYVVALSFSLARAAARQKPLDDPSVLEVLRDCCARMGVRRAPTLVETSAVRTPALHGWIRPRLMLPHGFTNAFSREEIRFVLLHELAHVRRHDLTLNWLITTLQVVHWFNPLLWFGFSRWRADREIACDAAALEAAGRSNRRAYGHTMLRLLQNFSASRPQPGLIGILENKHQLQRRMKMIAGFAPARRPFVAVALIAILGVVGLTDAQVAPALSSAEAATPATSPGSAAIPQPTGAYVLFLLNGSESMLGQTGAMGDPGVGRNATDYTERGRTYSAERRTGTDEEKRAAPKWQHALQTLGQMLSVLPAETDFRVALFFDDTVEGMGGRIDPNDRQAVPNTIARLRSVVPRGAANLESAFGFVAEVLSEPRPERIVLITDGLPTTSRSSPAEGEITEAQRIRFFQLATKRLPPRIPVHTVLMPAPTVDPGAAGLYWELANVTRGQLTIPAKTGGEPRTHLAFVIDTSGSMRDPKSGGLWPIVIDTVEATLDAHPQLAGVQLLDGDGRFVLGRNRASGMAAWHANTPETREQIRRVLGSYRQDSVSNPAPGVINAIRFLHDKDAPDVRMGLYVLGDEYNSSDPAGVVLDRIDALNPRDASGRRAITISAIGFPTTIRYQFSMGNTGLRFANLMRLLTYEHDGSFIALPDL